MGRWCSEERGWNQWARQVSVRYGPTVCTARGAGGSAASHTHNKQETSQQSSPNGESRNPRALPGQLPPVLTARGVGRYQRYGSRASGAEIQRKWPKGAAVGQWLPSGQVTTEGDRSEMGCGPTPACRASGCAILSDTPC